MKKITLMLLTLLLMIIGGGANKVKAGNVYGSISVATGVDWNGATEIATYTAVNGWQILYTGLPSGDITAYKRIHVTLSSMSDNIANLRLCIKDTDGHDVWINLIEGENTIDIAALAAANPNCDFTSIKDNDITIWSPSTSVSTVDADHPASVKIQNVYMQCVKNVTANTLIDEITDISYITSGGTFMIANTAGTSIQAWLGNDPAAVEKNINSISADMYYYFNVEVLPPLDIDEDGNDDEATYYRIAIKNGEGTAKPDGYYWSDNYVNIIGWGDLWSTTCDADKEAGYGRDGAFNAVWTISYVEGSGFKFYNPKRNRYMTLRSSSEGVNYVKLYKNVEFNINSALDKEDNEANDEIFAFSKATGFDEETNTFTNGGWTFETPVDISDWDYLVITTVNNASNMSCKIKITDDDGNSIAGNQYSGSAAGTGADMYLDRWNHENALRISLDYLRATKGMDISKIKSLKFENNSGGDCVISIANVYLTDYNNTKIVGWYPEGDAHRDYSETGKFGTICLPYKASYTAAEIYSITGAGDNNIIIEKVNGLLEAGKPYFFMSADEIGAHNEGTIRNVNFFRADFDKYDASIPITSNGLIGTFTAIEAVPQGNDIFVLSSNKLYQVNSAVSLAANRAYVDKSQITNTQATSRTISLAFDDATAIENMQVVNEIANQAIYNLSGQRVAQPTKGLYIVNGKKVIIK